MLIVETQRSQFKYAMDKEQINYSINTHMKRIQENNVEGKKLMKLLQIIGQFVYKYGVSFMSNKTMAKEIKTSVRTVQRYVDKLVSLNAIVKIPTARKNNKGQTSNTIVILPVIKSLYDAVCHGGCHTLNPSFKPLKQEKNNYIYNQLSEEKLNQKEILMKFAEYKINDIVEKGILVDSPSSYIMKVFKNEVRKAEARRMMFLSKSVKIVPVKAVNDDYKKETLNELGIF